MTESSQPPHDAAPADDTKASDRPEPLTSPAASSLDIPPRRIPDWLKKVALGLLTLALGGGGLQLLLQLYDRWASPSIEVLGMMPFAVYEKFPVRRPEGFYVVGNIGIACILYVRNARHRPELIGSLRLDGKIHPDFQDCSDVLGRDGTSFEEMAREWQTKKPYRMISWVGWPTDEPGPVKLEAREEKFIRFTFREPVMYGRNEYAKDISGYFGFEDGSQHPKLPTTLPVPSLIFQGPLHPQLRPEIVSGVVKMTVRVGTRDVPVPVTKIRRTRRTSQEAWSASQRPQDLYFDPLMDAVVPEPSAKVK